MDIGDYLIDGAAIIGRVGTGVSEAVHILAKDGLVYVAKARYLNPKVFYTPANELLGSVLADYFHLPIPKWKIIRHIGEHFFGSELQKTFAFDPKQAQLPYQEILANIFVFDVWICNTDRHLGNFVYVETMPGRPALKIIDHGYAFFGPGQDCNLFGQKDSKTDISEFVKADIYRKYVRSFEDLSPMLERINRIPRDDLVHRVQMNMYLESNEKDLAIDILWNRREKLPDLMYQNRQLFG